MKLKFIKTAFSVLTLCASISCNTQKQDGNCTINGIVADNISDTAYYVYIGDSLLNMPTTEVPVDTIIVKNKKFQYVCNIKEPRWIYLQAIFQNGNVCGTYVDFLIVPKSEANIKVCNGYYEIGGSPFYEQWHTLDTLTRTAHQKTQQITENLKNKGNITQEDVNKANKETLEIVQNVKKYILDHKNEEGTMFMGSLMGLMSSHELFDDISPEIRNGQFKTYIDRIIEAENKNKEAEQQNSQALAKTSEGKMFTDFSADFDGKTQKLSDYVGKGKYVLVDFWASWCGPCRGEIPNLIAVYNKYKGKDFDVIGVASWDEPNDTQQAINDMKIPYPQIMNAQASGTNAYGIRGIPEIILFAPDGTILKRGLRGEQIEIAVKTYLKK